jgi:hypothetical protein
MQFADSAGKIACGAQFCTCQELQSLFYSYWEVLKVSSISVVENERSSPEINFKVIKESLLAFLNTLQKVADYLLQWLQKLVEPF